MKIVLVAIHCHPSPQAVPLACAFLKGALLADRELSSRVSAEIVNFFADDDPARCCREILGQEPDVVAFSVYVWGTPLAFPLAKALRAANPQLVICAGGAEPTANPAPFLAEGAFDFLIRGEGEGPFLKTLALLAQGRAVDAVPGVLLPGATDAPAAPPASLASIPSPYLAGILTPAAGDGVLWQLSRGCDFGCEFCFDRAGSTAVRRFPMERVEAELRLFAQQQIAQVFVLDSTFNKVPQRAKDILRLIRKIAPGIHFHFEVRSEFIDAEMAELFASITCSLQIGLQSSSPEILRSVGRGLNPADFRKRIALLNDSGAIFGFDLIYGLPGDTLERFRQSLDFALELYPNHLDIFPLAVLPGTKLFSRAGELGLRHLDAPPYTLTSTPGFTGEKLQEARQLALACDLFYSRGKAVAWFNCVVAPLRLSGSDFLGAFASWLSRHGVSADGDHSEAEIWQLQRDFLQHAFRGAGKQKLLPVALDLVDYHQHYAKALLAPVQERPLRPVKRRDLLRATLTLAPSASLVRFNYEILELLDAGEPDLAAFARDYEPSGSCAVIYPFQGEVCTESLSEPYFRLLESLGGTKGTASLCAEVGLADSEAAEFLEFALSHGIVASTHS